MEKGKASLVGPRPCGVLLVDAGGALPTKGLDCMRLQGLEEAYGTEPDAAEPHRIQVAHDLVRSQINAMLPPNVQITDIARLPYLIGPTTRAGDVPNTPNGLYAMVLASFATPRRTTTAH